MDQQSTYRGTNTPVLLSSSVAIGENATGTLDATKLTAPYRKPILVDEVRWTLTGAGLLGLASTAGGGSGLGNPVGQALGALISTKFQLGRLACSSLAGNGNFIPTWLYSPTVQSVSFETAADQLVASGSNQPSTSYYRWKLPRPLYVPAGNVFLPSLSRGIDGNGGTINCVVSLAGRFLEPGIKPPKKLQVPYVAAFQGVIGSVSAMYSTDQDLFNPFQTDLHVQRFTGRIQAASSIPGPNTIAAEVISDEQVSPFIQVSIRDSYGMDVIRDFVNFSSVFDSNRHGWTFHKVLKLHERYIARFQNVTTPASATQVQMAMIGWREEEFQ